MKRLIAAVSFAVIAAPVVAAPLGAPFEQTQFDRGLATQQVVDNSTGGASTATSSSSASGVWANDYNFIAPAQ